MNNFKIIPLSAAYAQQIRNSRKDQYGHNVIEKVATGLGPCRVSLKPFERNVDNRLLFTHSPFEADNVYNQPGPVFIHAKEVEAYNDIYRFPAEIKANKKSFPLTLVGYDDAQMMVLTKLVGDDDVEVLINNVFDSRPDVAFLHARNAQACCFICKIERRQ
ncbi:DUF1203 domain-containing protein [Panacibacter sp. DH6]|uniref:DUF1203 domain-containing protein n=1 Tax=Panacibacter microcysteis TaxID=2793269 RepID=A0A931GYE5_9BACT|nr:DUF1203 domain-containing protein [Panacibacter microcysteis]MBG9375582.1 DUF1203 domain-containing protein [Panacibacter microcysteis]